MISAERYAPRGRVTFTIVLSTDFSYAISTSEKWPWHVDHSMEPTPKGFASGLTGRCTKEVEG